MKSLLGNKIDAIVGLNGMIGPKTLQEEMEHILNTSLLLEWNKLTFDNPMLHHTQMIRQNPYIKRKFIEIFEAQKLVKQAA